MRCVAVLGVIAVMAGCGSGTAPRPFGGTYDLISVDGKADPQSLFPGEKNPEVVGGTLVVTADTLVVTLDEQSFDDAGHPVDDVAPVVERIGYTRQGDRLAFTNGSLGSSGVILGSNVKLTFGVMSPSLLVIGVAIRRFLFEPSRNP